MPHNWVEMSNTPPPWDEVSGKPADYKDAVARTVEQFGGSLKDMFWSVSERKVYALVDGPDDAVRTKAMLRALPSLGNTALLDVDEAREAFELGSWAD